MSSEWCPVCQTRHPGRVNCPGELLATGPERHGWRVVVRTATRSEVYGVLVAEAGEWWRARILTYPNILWSVPGGRGTLKFVGPSAQEAEKQAIEFIREHCRSRDYVITDEVPVVESLRVERETRAARPSPGARTARHLRQWVVRFGERSLERVGRTADISRGGLCVVTDRPYPTGTRLKLQLEMNEYRVHLIGRVAWSRSRAAQGRPPGMGVHLQSPPRVYVDYLDSLDDEG